jgi:hypothetical protein
MWCESVIVLLPTEHKDEVLRKLGPVVFVEIEPELIVDVNLIVAMAVRGWCAGIVDPVGEA